MSTRAFSHPTGMRRSHQVNWCNWLVFQGFQVLPAWAPLSRALCVKYKYVPLLWFATPLSKGWQTVHCRAEGVTFWSQNNKAIEKRSSRHLQKKRNLEIRENLLSKCFRIPHVAVVQVFVLQFSKQIWKRNYVSCDVSCTINLHPFVLPGASIQAYNIHVLISIHRSIEWCWQWKHSFWNELFFPFESIHLSPSRYLMTHFVMYNT